jgi:phospholipid-binding lipoprotein MlaA
LGKKIAIAVLAGVAISMLVTVCAQAGETGGVVLAQDDTWDGDSLDDWDDESLDDFDFMDEEDEQPIARVADPLRGWNEAMFVFNDKAYFWVLKPVAQGYSKVMPKPARTGINNFFHNILMPVRFVNCILQGKGKAATGEFGRFMLNSTVGVLGFGDPAAKYPDLNPDSEDLGQTFGRYGIGNGFYIVWPVLGPSTLRDSIGTVGDWYLDPITYLDETLVRYSLRAGKQINATSLRIGEYEALREAAIDPYTAFRDFYIQYRQEKVVK